MRILCVAEKPSIAKSVSSILSEGQSINNVSNLTANRACSLVGDAYREGAAFLNYQRAGKDKFCRNYDFSYNMPGYGVVEMTMTSVRGHLTEMDFSEGFRKWSDCDPYALFDAPIFVGLASVSDLNELHICRTLLCQLVEGNQDKKLLAANLKEEARRAHMLMIWTDCDREGEHIGKEVVTQCRMANRNLEVKRARFSAIIASQIHNACRNSVQLDESAAAAVEARQELDLRIGAAFTRLQTLELQKIPELNQNLISYGPCQIPTLGFVVEQYERVKGFVPEPFWYIAVSHERNEGPSRDEPKRTVEFRWQRNRLFDHAVAVILFEACLEEPTAVVRRITTKPTKKWKPYPLTTVELQKAGSRLLHLSAKVVLEIAEKLYNKGFLSYPRTETDQYDKNFDFRSLIQKQTADLSWGQYAATLINQESSFEKPRNGRNNDNAHPPIHPTAHAANLEGNEKRVYEYITRRFLASCSKDAIGRQIVVAIGIASEEFVASGLTVVARNYLEVFTYDHWNGNVLPEFQEGEQFIPTSCNLKEGETSAPRLLTEADLVNLMDKNGIGTDATIAEHIDKVISREYIVRHKEGRVTYLLPSTLGSGLVDGYNRIDFDKSLTKPVLRRETEFRMKLVCEGRTTKREMMETSIEEYRHVYMRARAGMHMMSESVKRLLQVGADDGIAGGGDNDDHHNNHGIPPPTRRSRSDTGSRGARRGTRDGGGASNRRSRGAISRRGRGSASLAPTHALGGGYNDDEDEEDDDDVQPGAGGAALRSTVRTSPITAPLRGASSVRNNSAPNNNLNDADAPRLPPKCLCENDCVERIVRKKGPNTGRVFWTCAEGESGCDFFEWIDKGRVDDNRPGEPSRRTAVPTKRSAPTPALASKIYIPDCHCSLGAVQRSVKKEGMYTGRAFFACSKLSSDEGRCNFFQWADEASASVGAQPTEAGPSSRRPRLHPPSRGTAETSRAGNSTNSEKRCQCKLEAAQRTVTKDGPNRGRKFWCCSKESARVRCGFFEWVDDLAVEGECELDRNGNRSGVLTASHTIGGGGTSASGSKYSLCNQEDHSTSDCLNRNDIASANGSGVEFGYSGRRLQASSTGGGGGGDGGECFHCQQPGHWASRCPINNGRSSSSYGRNQSVGSNVGTNRRGGGTHSGGGECFKCHQLGHWASNCPNLV